jgi:hypothetical protein
MVRSHPLYSDIVIMCPLWSPAGCFPHSSPDSFGMFFATSPHLRLDDVYNKDGSLSSLYSRRCDALRCKLSLLSSKFKTFEMFIYSLITLALAIAVGATSYSQHNDTDNLTVKTRTGTFIGDLNDTYTDVRQFKWIPYAKVSSNLAMYYILSNEPSRLLVTGDGLLQKDSTMIQPHTTRLHLVPRVRNTSPPFHPHGLSTSQAT